MIPPPPSQEIERLGDRPDVVQVLMASTTRQPCGQRRYHPLYEAAAAYGLPLPFIPAPRDRAPRVRRPRWDIRRAIWSGTPCCR